MGDPTQSDEESVLYVKTTCMVCRNQQYNCPYCDGEGQNYVEAADKTVARWIRGLSNERRDDIMGYMRKVQRNEENN